MKALISCGSDCRVSGPIGWGREDDDDADGGGGGLVVVVRLGEVGQVQSERTRKWHRRVMWPISGGVDGLGAALVLPVSADTGRW